MTTAKNLKPAAFKWGPISKKQKRVMTWWSDPSPVKDKHAIICDGSVRSGKTVSMSFSFVLWAMARFNNEKFGMAGKTIGSLRRNVVQPLKRILKGRKGFRVKDHRAENILEIKYQGRVNFFHIFGGKDERSQDLIQGITLAGMFFDEVALMPKSFVDQATARCSVKGAKFWFNCNPAGPYHWFKTEWLDQLEKKKAVHIHFTMRDNLSLDAETIERYENLYSGVFFKRFILGLWVLAEGIIYDMFDEEVHKVHPSRLPERFERYFVGVDYGHTNATVFLLIGQSKGKLYVIREYYHNSASGENLSKQKSPSEYANDFIQFISGIHITKIFIDPSAKGFITELRKKGVRSIINADNDVLPGIGKVSVALSEGLLYISEQCVKTLQEFGSYTWDIKAQERGEDKPLKKFDHAMDALRYAVYMVLDKGQGVGANVIGTSAAAKIFNTIGNKADWNW